MGNNKILQLRIRTFPVQKTKYNLKVPITGKHTEDAFMTKTIASMNGVNGNSYVVNGGDVGQ